MFLLRLILYAISLFSFLCAVAACTIDADFITSIIVAVLFVAVGIFSFKKARRLGKKNTYYNDSYYNQPNYLNDDIKLSHDNDDDIDLNNLSHR